MGAHLPVRALSTPRSTHVMAQSSIILIIILLNAVVTSSGPSEADILLKFKESLQNNEGLSHWNTLSNPPCQGKVSNWKGVLCSPKTGVFGLNLEKLGLKGTIDFEVLNGLPGLISLSLANNDFEGTLPEIKKLKQLKNIYLSNNKFSGEIPADAFDGMTSLKKIHLGNNSFTGSIPRSLISLPILSELTLENNQFTGDIPRFEQTKWSIFNVSNNKLEGQIPHSVNHFDVTSFQGNSDLCGTPLPACDIKGNLSLGTIVVVSIVVVAAIVAIILVVFILLRRKRIPNEQEQALAGQKDPEKADNEVRQPHKHQQPAHNAEQVSPPRATESKKSDPNVKLTFLRDDRPVFDMTDLLKASAEILGSGVFGSTYKAVVGGGSVMVVKRYRKMNNVDKEEFTEHMTRLGNLKHPNLLPIVAFYYRKEEKLLVTDHIANVSLAIHLHGNKSRGRPAPDWSTRLKIIKGVARGVDYLYTALPCLIVPCGHLKSSNVLLDPKTFEPLITDYGLIPMVNPEHAQDNMIAYKSPEYKQSRRITKKTDVWGLGILILEILTGKFPNNFLQQGKGSDVDLSIWVQSILREEWTTEVFDKDMSGTAGAEGEIIKLLKIALECCDTNVDNRLDIKEALEKIEKIRDRD